MHLSTSNATISGSYAAAQLDATTVNGAISGTYLVEGRCEIKTNNAFVSGEYDVGILDVWTRNAAVGGRFAAREGLVVDNANGAVSGTFSSPGGIIVRSVNAGIKGSFCAGKELRLKTANSSIEVTVELLGEEGARERTPELLDAKKEPVARGRVEMVVENANGKIDVLVEEHPKGVGLDARLRSSNGHVKLQDLSPFVGSFKVRLLLGRCRAQFVDFHLAGIDLERSRSFRRAFLDPRDRLEGAEQVQGRGNHCEWRRSGHLHARRFDEQRVGFRFDRLIVLAVLYLATRVLAPFLQAMGIRRCAGRVSARRCF